MPSTDRKQIAAPPPFPPQIYGMCPQHFQNIFSSETTGPIKVKFHMESPWDGERKFVQLIQVTWPRWPPCPYMVKTLKNQLGTWYATGPMSFSLKLGMQHQVLEYYQVCSNDDPGFTLTYFTARSNLVPYAFVWEKGNGFFRNYCSLWCQSW